MPPLKAPLKAPLVDQDLEVQIVVVYGEPTWWLFLADGPLPESLADGDKIRGWWMHPVPSAAPAPAPAAGDDGGDDGGGGDNSDDAVAMKFRWGGGTRDTVQGWGVIGRDIPLYATAPAGSQGKLAATNATWALRVKDRRFVDKTYADFLRKEREMEAQRELDAGSDDDEDDESSSSSSSSASSLEVPAKKKNKKKDKKKQQQQKKTKKTINNNNGDDDDAGAFDSEDDVPFSQRFSDARTVNVNMEGWELRPSSTSETDPETQLLVASASFHILFRLPENKNSLTPAFTDFIIVHEEALQQQPQQWIRTVYIPTRPSVVSSNNSSGSAQAEPSRLAVDFASAALAKKNDEGNNNEDGASEELCEAGTIFVALRRGVASTLIATEAHEDILLRALETSKVAPFAPATLSAQQQQVAPPLIRVESEYLQELTRSAMRVGSAQWTSITTTRKSNSNNKNTRASTAQQPRKLAPRRRQRHNDEMESESTGSLSDSDDDDDDEDSDSDDDDDDDSSDLDTEEDSSDEDLDDSDDSERRRRRRRRGKDTSKAKKNINTTTNANRNKRKITTTTTTRATTKQSQQKPTRGGGGAVDRQKATGARSGGSRRSLSDVLFAVQPAVSTDNNDMMLDDDDTPVPAAAAAPTAARKPAAKRGSKKQQQKQQQQQQQKQPQAVEKTKEQLELEQMESLKDLLEDVEASVRLANADDAPHPAGAGAAAPGQSVVPDFGF